MINFILDAFGNISLKDITDMVIITISFYFVLIWLKKARARFMLVGVGVVVLVYILARFFNLYLTTMLLQAFFAAALIVFVVIFQEDLRHFFERIGIWGIAFRRQNKISFKPEINILSIAIANLSRKQIGALVAIKGGDPVERHIEAGINLNGALSAVLLESIFAPNAPAHDGAVIVDGANIVEFRAHLPLSTNINEIGRLGTRHAAAVGLTEYTDALCLVVSEETGAISVVQGGRINKIKDIDELRIFLEKFYNKKFPGKKKVPLVHCLARHFLDKIIAVILAIIMWFSFGQRTQLIRRDFIVPVEYRNLAAERIISEPKLKTATITLSGSERSFNFLNPKELKVSLDMAGIKDGENNLSLNKDLIRYPTELSLINVEPDNVTLKVFRMINFSVPIKVKTQGRLRSGILLRDLKVIPKEIYVVVPSTIAKDNIIISTEPIDLRAITETTTFMLKLNAPAAVRFVEDKQPVVKVIVEIDKRN